MSHLQFSFPHLGLVTACRAFSFTAVEQTVRLLETINKNMGDYQYNYWKPLVRLLKISDRNTGDHHHGKLSVWLLGTINWHTWDHQYDYLGPSIGILETISRTNKDHQYDYMHLDLTRCSSLHKSLLSPGITDCNGSDTSWAFKMD